MLCYVMLCYVMLCYVMLCYVMLCYVMLCYVMLCYVMLCYVMLCLSNQCYSRTTTMIVIVYHQNFQSSKINIVPQINGGKLLEFEFTPISSLFYKPFMLK